MWLPLRPIGTHRDVAAGVKVAAVIMTATKNDTKVGVAEEAVNKTVVAAVAAAGAEAVVEVTRTLVTILMRNGVL
jgi:hypothetical protein